MRYKLNSLYFRWGQTYIWPIFVCCVYWVFPAIHVIFSCFSFKVYWYWILYLKLWEPSNVRNSKMNVHLTYRIEIGAFFPELYGKFSFSSHYFIKFHNSLDGNALLKQNSWCDEMCLHLMLTTIFLIEGNMNSTKNSLERKGKVSTIVISWTRHQELCY